MKSKKRPSNISENYDVVCPVSNPDVMNSDDIAYLLDEDLYRRLEVLNADRVKVVDAQFEPKRWEVEISYVLREMQMRFARHAANERYSREFITAFMIDESKLPAADWDNTKFMVVN